MCGCSEKCVLWCPCACHDEQRKRVTFVDYVTLHERIEALEERAIQDSPLAKRVERLEQYADVTTAEIKDLASEMGITYGQPKYPTPPPEAATREEKLPGERFEAEHKNATDAHWRTLARITEVEKKLSAHMDKCQQFHTVTPPAPAAEARPEQTGKRCAYGMTRQEHFTPGQRAGKGEK